MLRDVDLIKYLPLFVAEYEEIQEITESENPEFRLAIKKVDQAKDNQFIISADEEGISRFEKLLGIRHKEKANLEDRRKEILARWNDVSGYTYKGLILRLNQLLGVGNYEIYPRFDNYELELEYRNKAGFESYIREIIPANIALSTQLAIVSESKFSVASISGEEIVISQPALDDLIIDRPFTVRASNAGTFEDVVIFGQEE